MAKRKKKSVPRKPRVKPATTGEDRNRLIMADLVAQSWKDPKFRAKLIQKPKAIMQNAGITGITDVDIRLLDNTNTTKHVVLPSNFSAENIHTYVDEYFQKILPLPPGQEVVFVQNTANLKNIVLPASPSADAGNLDASHAHVLAAAGYEAVVTSATVNANMNAVVLVNAVITGPTNAVAITSITDPVVVAVAAVTTYVA